MKYSLNKLSGKLSDYAFDFGGVIALRNFTVRTNGNRLIVESAKDANFAILDAFFNEVEIDGVVYDTVESAQLALQKLVFNPDPPVILSESKLEELNSIFDGEYLNRVNALITKGDKAVKDANKAVADAISKVDGELDDAVAKAVDSAVFASFPVGLISMWSGKIDDIPDGWILCANYTGKKMYSLGRFIVGAGGSYSVNDVGGESAHTLTVDEMPIHTHTGSTTEDGRHHHKRNNSHRDDDTWTFGEKVSNNIKRVPRVGGFGWYWHDDGSPYTSYDGKHTHDITIYNSGGGRAHENRPPYYALFYIMYVGE